MKLQNVVGLALALALPSHPSFAQPSALTTLTELADRQTKVSKPLRADVTAEIDGVEGKKQDRLVVLFRPGPDGNGGPQVYLESEKGKAKVLMLGDADWWTYDGKKAAKAAGDAAVAATSWWVEDLLPFDSQRCGMMRIVDIRSDQMTITCEPKKEPKSAYSLFVYKFDREKGVPIQTLYYKDTLSNLVKMRRNDEFVEVGGGWRPGKITMQDYKLNTRDEFTIRWSAEPKFRPELFDSKTLASPSGIDWPSGLSGNPIDK